MTASRVIGNQFARSLPAAQGRDGHTQCRCGFTYANKSFHFADVNIDMDRLKPICSHPMRVRDFSQFGFTEVLFPELQDANSDDSHDD
jgi:hypothetical protein